MKLRILLLGVLFPTALVVLFFSCSSESDEKKIAKAMEQVFKKVYLEEAVIMNEGGRVYSGIDAVIDFRRRAIFHIDSTTTIKEINANTDREIDYLIQKIWTTEEEVLENLIITEKKGNQKARAFEFIAGAAPNNVDLKAIDESRNKWMELCNQHNAEQLVKNLYTENAVYYNHKPVVVGRAKITEEYAYMNDENYSLQLEPIIVEPVNPRIVFEIGQCSGTYNGKYMLVWQKVTTGEWQIFFDSNI